MLSGVYAGELIYFHMPWSTIIGKDQNIALATTPLGTNISPFKGTLEDDFPFPQVGYVSSRKWL